MSTELATIKAVNGSQLSVYDKVDPLGFIEAMGKAFSQSGVCGCKTEADGKVLALACMLKRQDPFEIDSRYHRVNGRLSLKADVMLADFRKAGGKFKWIKTGDDGQEAAIELTFDGNTITSRFTIEDAKRAGLLKAGGNWEKTPGNMLRARATSNGIRMVAPEVSAGVYTAEEVSDFAPEVTQAAAPTPVKVETVSVDTTSSTAATAQVQRPAETIIDVEVESPAAEVVNPSPDSDPDYVDASPQTELRLLLEQSGQLGDFERDILPKLGVQTVKEIPFHKAMKILDNLKKKCLGT